MQDEYDMLKLVDSYADIFGVFTNPEAYQQFINAQQSIKGKVVSDSFGIVNENRDAEQRLDKAKKGVKVELTKDNEIAEKMKKHKPKVAVKKEEKIEDL